MRQARQAGSDPAFLVKALSEAGGELQRQLMQFPPGDLLREGTGRDDGWCALGIAAHMRDVERGIGRQIRTITGSPGADIGNVDMDDIPFREDYEFDNEDQLVHEFQYLRRETSYQLWDLPQSWWDRSGIHRYRGELSIREIVRELYQHDLEHLWQMQRLAEGPLT